MKNKILTTAAILLFLGSLPAAARDFTYTYEGQTLTYTVLDESSKTVETKKGSTDISGNLVIPSVAKDGDTEYSVTQIGDYTFNYCSGLTSVTLPNSVTRIGKFAFSDCSGLTSVDIPNSVTSLGWSAFSNCSGLTSLTLSNLVTSIEAFAFIGCSGLTSLTLPNSLTSIGSSAFSRCSGLKSVILPNSVTEIGYSAFDGCSGLEHDIYNDKIFAYAARPLNRTTVEIPDGIEIIANGAFQFFSGMTSVTLPNSVTTIGIYAFFYCSGLTSITLPNSVTEIGVYTFEGCNGLTHDVYNDKIFAYATREPNRTTVEIPDGIEIIAGGVFSGFRDLTSVTIPNSVTTIGQSAFYGCSGLKSLTLPNSVTTIGVNAFDGCSGLTHDVYNNKIFAYAARVPNRTTVEIPDGIEIIAITAFSSFRGLASMTIPNSVTEVGASAFYGCSDLKSVTLSNSVTEIGEYAFYSCSGLTSLTLPNSVTTIGNYAFSDCSGLTSVNYDAEEPIVAESTVFDASTYERAVLYVNPKAIEKCKEIDPWKNFTTIQPNESGIEEVAADFDAKRPCEVFNLGGVKIADSADGLASGIYIVRQGNTVKKIAVK